MKLSDYIPLVGNDSDVSRKAGLDRSTISRIRRGIIDPPISTAERIISGTGGSIVIVAPVKAADASLSAEAVV